MYTRTLEHITVTPYRCTRTAPTIPNLIKAESVLDGLQGGHALTTMYVLKFYGSCDLAYRSQLRREWTQYWQAALREPVAMAT